MKKKMTVILCLTAAAVLITAAALWIFGNRKSAAGAVAVVLEVNGTPGGGQSLFLFNALDSSRDGSDLFYAGLPPDVRDTGGAALTAADVAPGQLVELRFSGLVQTTYPATYADVYSIRVLGEAASGLYALAVQRNEEWQSEYEAMLPAS